MAGIPQNFQAISNVLANYNFVDIASGTGYINFYLGKTVDKKILSNFSYYSDTIITNFSVTNAAFTKTIDEDFDTVMNRPLDVRGLGIVNIGVFGLSNQVQIYVIPKLRKWDGVTETDICENQSRTFVSTGAVYDELSIDLDAPLTHFKIGETLRLTIEVWTKTTGAASSGIYAHDPKGRLTGWDATGAVPSTLMFQCPVRLNL